MKVPIKVRWMYAARGPTTKKVEVKKMNTIGRDFGKNKYRVAINMEMDRS